MMKKYLIGKAEESTTVKPKAKKEAAGGPPFVVVAAGVALLAVGIWFARSQ
jgi:hypothetical protein